MATEHTRRTNERLHGNKREETEFISRAKALRDTRTNLHKKYFLSKVYKNYPLHKIRDLFLKSRIDLSLSVVGREASFFLKLSVFLSGWALKGVNFLFTPHEASRAQWSGLEKLNKIVPSCSSFPK